MLLVHGLLGWYM